MKTINIKTSFSLLLLISLYLISCKPIAPPPLYAKLFISLNETDSDSTTIVLNLTIENILKDTLEINGKKATFFHRQFAFEIETENQTFLFFPMKTGAYMRQNDTIKLPKGKSINFKINLLENYRSILSETPAENMEGVLRCYYDFKLERESIFETDYEINFKSAIMSNTIKI